MNELSKPERIALISAGISLRYLDYLAVKNLPGLTLAKVAAETGLCVKFISKCRKIAAKHSI